MGVNTNLTGSDEGRVSFLHAIADDAPRGGLGGDTTFDIPFETTAGVLFDDSFSPSLLMTGTDGSRLVRFCRGRRDVRVRGEDGIGLLVGDGVNGSVVSQIGGGDNCRGLRVVAVVEPRGGSGSTTTTDRGRKVMVRARWCMVSTRMAG
jgi:hypothetical protein